MSSIVTLTTDYGLKDHYVGVLKGQLLSTCKDITLVDISHNIRPFDVISASYVLKHASTRFPQDSIHFVNINMKEGNNRYLLVKAYDQYYICPDNGLICLLFPDEKFDAYVISELDSALKYSDLHYAIASVINRIKEKEDVQNIGRETTHYITLKDLQPIVFSNTIKGSAFYVDMYENVIVNITKELFDQHIGEKTFSIQFRSYHIQKISNHYSDVPEGEFLCLFNDAGYLEIAINKGNAAGLLGLQRGSTVLIESQ